VKTRGEKFQRLFRAGRFAPAAREALRRSGRAFHPPVDFFDVYFPADDGRQDLVNWLTVRRLLLEPHRRECLALRRSLQAAFGPRGRAGEEAALLAYCDLLLGDYDRAAAVMRRAVETAPPSFGLHFLHAVSLWIKSARDRSRALMPAALAAINGALEHDAKNVYAYYVRVGLRRELEDVAGRLADAETMLRLRPDFVFARVEIAETLGETKHYRNALKEFDFLLKRYPDQAWGWAQRGRLRGIYGYHRLALKDFAAAIRLDPACGPIYAWRGEARRRMGEYAKAFDDFAAAIRIDPSYRLSNQWRGRLQLILGRCREAVDDFDRTLELEPREELASAWRAEALWKMGRCREAARGFDALHPAEPKNTWNRVVKDGEAQETAHHFRLNAAQDRRENAFWRSIDEILSRRKDDAWAWAFRGRCRTAEGLLREGCADLTRALQLDPKLAYAHRWRGECLRRMGAGRRALADFDRALALDPRDRWAAAWRALARAALGEQAGAESDFALALSPREQRFSVVHLWHGQWLHAQGRDGEAREAVEAAFMLDGKDPRVLEWRARLSAAS
jgi:tetratricopeptide (TPR) repeat protein